MKLGESNQGARSLDFFTSRALFNVSASIREEGGREGKGMGVGEGGREGEPEGGRVGGYGYLIGVRRIDARVNRQAYGKR